MPTQPKSPGRDFSAVLHDKQLADWDDTVFFEFENVRSIRTREWKLIVRLAPGPNELYDLKADPGETKNLYDDADVAKQRDALRVRLDTFFKEYVDPQYDLWNGGRSKAHVHYLKQAK